MTVSGTSLTEFALAPPTEEGDETVIKRWEGVYSSVAKFFEATKCQRLPMPAVSVVHALQCPRDGLLVVFTEGVEICYFAG